jgi:glucosamine--fructose-6-phosphate aminotransferase (isomerizing)
VHRPAARQQQRDPPVAAEGKPDEAAEAAGDAYLHAGHRRAAEKLAPLTSCAVVSILRDEIAEQPAVLERLLDRQMDAITELAGKLREAPPRFVLIAARGSSDNVARYAQHVLGRLCRVPVALATPSLYTLYDTSPRLDRALVIGISQSGASPDVTAVVADGAEQGQVTLAITNDPDSPMGRAAEHVIALGTGEERSVAATKTYTASLAAVAALAAAVNGDNRLQQELRAAPKAVAEQLEEPVDRAVGLAAPWQRCAVVGRGANYATAFEAALKVKELTGIAAEPYSPPDLMHGPVAVVGPDHGVLAFAPPGPTAGDVLDAVREAERRGAPPIVASAEAGSAIRLVPQPDWLSPLGAVIAAQLLAAGVAERRGIDVDTPFGLSKITRTT